MQPQTAAQKTQKADGLKQKYRIFHPQSTIWVKNPFSRDVVFQVADELNRQFQYRIQAGSTAELPGGAIATLGLKAIIDQLIQNNKKDVLSIWDMSVRAKYEKDVLLKVKEAPQQDETGPAGEINLSIKDKDVPKAGDGIQEPEQAFPDLGGVPDGNHPRPQAQPQPTPADGRPEAPALPQTPEEEKAKQELDQRVNRTVGALPATTLLDDASE